MLSFIARRLGISIFTILGASIVVFSFTQLLPGDVVSYALFGGEGGMSSISDETVAAMKKKMGIDRPLPVQYLSWLKDIGTGEMGYSLIEKGTVREVLQRRILPTAQLAIQAVLLSWIIGLPLGIISALRQGSVLDYISRFISIIGLSLPSFWVGIMIVWIMATQFSYFPPLEYLAPWQNPWISFQITITASVVLGFILMAYIARMSRSSMLEVMSEDFIRTARSKGLRERVVIVRHALKIGVLPVLTLSAVHMGAVLGGTAVIEQVFNINGLGRTVVESVIKRDIIVVQNVVVMLTGFFIILNLATDLMYGWLDPRIRRT
jgi:peptide/nickel transport system permease protein